MFDVGGGEFLLIIIAIVVLFGPKKLPEMARSVGKGIAYLRRAQSDFERSVHGLQSEIDSVVDINGDKNKARKAATAGQADTPGKTATKLPADPPDKIDTSGIATAQSQSDDSAPSPDSTPESTAGKSSNSDLADGTSESENSRPNPGLSAIRPADGMINRHTSSDRLADTSDSDGTSSADSKSNSVAGNSERRKQA